MVKVTEMQKQNNTCNCIPDKSFQDEYDQYVADAYAILNDDTREVSEDIQDTLKLGIRLLETYRNNIQEVEFYKSKYTPVVPNELEKSNLKKCYIGKCSCGRLLIQSKDMCCPSCKQFIKWPER